MSIYRGTGGSSTTTDETTINAVNQKAAEAATSASNAASSASSAATSASTANTKASQASTSADSAATSATQASASKDTAVTSATAAQAAQVAAETAQTAAESAETNAVLYGNMANTAAGSATSSATAAASSASAAQSTYADTLALGTTASNAATAAATSATEAESASAQAAGYASDASTSASNAASSATSAATYATSAQAAEANTIALFDQFGDQYLGPKASDPSVDNDGDALTEGDVYWNTTDNVLKFYNGTSWSAPEDVASTAAANALVSETNAATSATSAANYASTASSAAASTAGSVTAAATSATNAANSAAAAAASETSAEGHKDLAYTYWQNAASAVTYQDLAAIAESKSVTAVDVFVYDTSKDSDGGAWRKRTQHTSWYNETLNTATRGARKEFPAVAVIVAESNKVTIYDGDDPSLPMWMVFNSASGYALYKSSNTNYYVSAKNGLLAVVSKRTDDLDGFYLPLDFIKDDTYLMGSSGINRRTLSSIGERNTASSFTGYISGSSRIVSTKCNDVAMTVLPNAPIDPATQLPIPTIAVATDGGVSVIKDDGNVWDIVGYYAGTHIGRGIKFFGNYLAVAFTNNISQDGYHTLYVYHIDDINADITGVLHNSDAGSVAPRAFFSITNGVRSWHVTGKENHIVAAGGYLYGSDKHLYLIDHSDDFSEYLVSQIASDYNTGWMHGDIKGAFLSDTTVETVGVDESTELATNGTFDTDVSGWTASTGNVSAASVSGQIEVTNNGSGWVYQQFPTVVGQRYKVTGDFVSKQGSGRAFVGTSIGSSAYGGATNAVVGFSFEFVATTTTAYISLGDAAGGTGVVNIYDNISVKQTGNLVVNGTFDTDISGWYADSSFPPASFVWDNGAMTVTGSGASYSGVETLIPTEVGRAYKITGSITGTGYISVDLDAPSGGWSPTSNVTYFTATSTQTGIVAAVSGSNVATFDNISVRLAESDRSVNNNGLEVHGEIVKSPVATGADLVAYSGFSADNYLEQPYNSDLDFGTGDFYVMGWVKPSQITDSSTVFHRALTASSGGLMLRIVSSNLTFFATSSTSFYEVLSAPAPSVNIWSKVDVIKRSGYVYLYINGVEVDSASRDIDLSYIDATLLLGSRHDSVFSSFDGSLALWRIGAGAPTAEQIAKIYEDEKVLFQEGAQATLYGSSDAVTALAYDDTTDLLHVGTSAGRSDFSGLRRVSNTTDAVGTAISASNGMIVEE